MKEVHFYRHEDLVIKKLSQDYGQEFLDYLDALYHENHENPVELPCKTIKTESSTELVTSSLKNMYMDFTYVLVDGSILHFEHYSTVLTDENLTNTALYAFEKHKETDEQIITIIVSTADPEKSLRELWLNPVTNFTPFRVIFLKEYDGNEKLKKIKKKINNNEKLTFNEIIELVLMALFKHTKPIEEVIEEVCYLTTKLVDATPNERNLLRWGLLLISDKYITDYEKLKELSHVITMNNDTIYGALHRYFQSEKEDYGAEKKQEEKIEIANTMLNKGYSLKEVVEITQLNMNTIKQLKLGK